MTQTMATTMDGGEAVFLRPFLDILQQDVNNQKISMATARPIVLKVLAHPEIFCGFDQVKSLCVPFLADTGGAASSSLSVSNTLDLFSFGCLKDYTSMVATNSDYYLALNDPALTKLGQLTVMTCIQDACDRGEMNISYTALAESLGCGDRSGDDDADATIGGCANGNPRDEATWIRNVEDVLIRCVYADVLRGKLCQKSRNFSWEGQPLPVVCPRDVAPKQIPQLLASLRGLTERLEASGTQLLEAEGKVLEGLKEDDRFWKAVQDRREKARFEGTTKSFAMGGPAGHSRLFGAGGGPSGGAGQWNEGGMGPRRSSGPRSSKRSRGASVMDTAFRM